MMTLNLSIQAWVSGCSSAALNEAGEMDVDQAIQSVLAIPKIKDLKAEQEECLKNFSEGKDIIGLLPADFGKSLI